MKITEITNDTYHLLANASNLLFESLWPIGDEGVSMNSFVIKGEKNAIIDGVCGWDGVPETLFEQFQKIDLDPKTIDYVIINHMEPDHSGWLVNFKNKICDDFTIVTHEKSVPLLERFYGITHSKVITVKDGSTLDLGNGHVLAFAEIPNVHWPETIATFDTKTGTIFPCDAFGSFGAVDQEANCDDQLNQEKIDFYEKQALRYYSNIVGAYSVPVRKAIEKAGGLPIKIVAPGHGMIWRKDPGKIIKDYLRYASYAQGPAKKQVTIIWGTMYGNTEKVIQPITETLEAEGISVKVHRVPDVNNYSYIIRDVWESSGVIIACPTYEYKLFPAMASAIEELGNKHAFNRKTFYCGSYGWVSCGEKEFKEIVERKKMKWDFLDPVIFKGAALAEDIDAIKNRTRELANAVKNWISG